MRDFRPVSLAELSARAEAKLLAAVARRAAKVGRPAHAVTMPRSGSLSTLNPTTRTGEPRS